MFAALVPGVRLSSRHFTGIDESVDARMRKLPNRPGHAFAKIVTADRIDFAVALIVSPAILSFAFGHGAGRNRRDKGRQQDQA
jgi:hypothetical protein